MEDTTPLGSATSSSASSPKIAMPVKTFAEICAICAC